MNAHREILKQRRSIFAGLLLSLSVLASSAWAQTNDLEQLLRQEKPAICKDQAYALCAGARCFVYDKVAYCTCDVLHGDSLSAPLTYDDGNANVCTLNAEGPNNGFMVSTFSLPQSIVAPSGNRALYTCPRTSRASYAKCDGGICFTSTTGHSAPGSNTPVGENQIVCSCPITAENPIQGLQIIGPYPCQKSFFQYCDSAVANENNGSTIYGAAPIGQVALSTYLLNGSVPPFNSCLP